MPRQFAHQASPILRTFFSRLFLDFFPTLSWQARRVDLEARRVDLEARRVDLEARCVD